MGKNTKVYEKLVRDKMPEVITANGHRGMFSMLTRAELPAALFKKLHEEVAELEAKPSIEEIGDVLAVLQTLASFYGGWDNVLKTHGDKLRSRGGFYKGIVLHSVEFPEGLHATYDISKKAYGGNGWEPYVPNGFKVNKVTASDIDDAIERVFPRSAADITNRSVATDATGNSFGRFIVKCGSAEFRFDVEVADVEPNKDGDWLEQ